MPDCQCMFLRLLILNYCSNRESNKGQPNNVLGTRVLQSKVVHESIDHLTLCPLNFDCEISNYTIKKNIFGVFLRQCRLQFCFGARENGRQDILIYNFLFCLIYKAPGHFDKHINHKYLFSTNFVQVEFEE